MTRTSDIRVRNRALLLHLLLQHGPLSRTQLAELSQLSTVTVNAITNELVSQRVLVEVRKTEGSAGRPAAILDLHPHSGTLIGIDVQGSSFTLITADVRGQQRQRRDIEVASQDGVTDALLGVLRDLTRFAQHGPIRQLALAVPAPVSPTLALQEPNSLPQLEMPRVLHAVKQLKLTPLIDNDANLAAIAEQQYGAGQGHASFGLLMRRASGIGFGLILQGHLYAGHNGLAGEIALAHWPFEGQPTLIEQLPPREQDLAIAYLVSGAAVTLNLSQLVVYEAQHAPDSQLLPLLRQLLPRAIPVVESQLDEDGPAVGALAVAVHQHAQQFTTLTTHPQLLRTSQEAL